MGISMVCAGYPEASCLRSSDGSICLEATSCPGDIAIVKGKTPRPANIIGSIIWQAVRNSKIRSFYKIKDYGSTKLKGET